MSIWERSSVSSISNWLSKEKNPMQSDECTFLKEILGPIYDLLQDKNIVEVSINADGAVFVERFGAKPVRHGSLDSVKTEQLLRFCATKNDLTITKQQPILSTRMPVFGHRIEGLIPPVVDAPTASIRFHVEKDITLQSYFANAADYNLLSELMVAKNNIMVAGGTSSGKTTFLNACLRDLSETCPDERIVIIEDTRELRSYHPNTQYLLTAEDIGVTEARLLKSTLRQAPDRIIVGEVRDGPAVLNLMQAWNTGHPGGLASIHANSAANTFIRLADMIGQVYASNPDRLIYSTLDYVIFLERDVDAPAVKELTRVHSDQNRFTLEPVLIN